MPLPKDFLSDEQVIIPAGGDFLPTGFISDWKAGIYWWFMTQEDLDKSTGWDDRRTLGDYTHYYFLDHDQAKEAYKASGGEYNPIRKWVFATESSHVLSFATEDAASKWGPRIIFDNCSVLTLRSKKQRHGLHLISLPSAVAAYATAAGWDNAGFDLSALLDPEAIFTDDFMYEQIGNPDTGEYEESELWKQRVGLWASLGEDDPKVYFPTGAKKLATKSEKLSKALGILHFRWQNPIWCCIQQVPDPGPKGAYNDSRLGIPTITAIYGDKAEAEKAAEEIRPSEEGVETGQGDLPPVPSAWEELVEEWKNQVREIKGDRPIPVVLKELKEQGDLEKVYSATFEDFKAWLPLV